MIRHSYQRKSAVTCEENNQELGSFTTKERQNLKIAGKDLLGKHRKTGVKSEIKGGEPRSNTQYFAGFLKITDKSELNFVNAYRNVKSRKPDKFYIIRLHTIRAWFSGL